MFLRRCAIISVCPYRCDGLAVRGSARCPAGPWRNFGDNNHFVIAKRLTEQRVVQEATDKKKKE